LRRLSSRRGSETVLVRHVGREVAVGPIQYGEGEAWAKPHHGIEKEERSKKHGSVVLLIIESVFRHVASAFHAAGHERDNNAWTALLFALESSGMRAPKTSSMSASFVLI
jgi:hypothetical protein